MLFRSDTPIKDDRYDLFSRKPLADILVTAIREYAKSASSCVTIGIYGAWGDGKTSLMNIVKTRLGQVKYKDRLLISSYNPWLIKDQETMLVDFFRTIMGAGFSRRVFSYIKQYGNLISYVAGQISERIAPLSGNAASSLVGGLLGGLPGDKLSLQECKNRVSTQLKKENRHLIVFIDDLDRLDRTEIQTVFRLIKQVADFDNVVYLVAMDEKRVSKALGASGSYGAQYLDKIIQIPFPLPKLQRADLSHEFKQSLISLMREFGIPDERIDVEMVTYSLIGLIRNERDIIRYHNTLLLLLPSVKDELNLNDFCKLEFLHMYNPAIYERIYRNRSALLRLHTSEIMRILNSQKYDEELQNKYDEAIKQFRTLYGEEVATIVKELFPSITRRPWELSYERTRINHIEFFDRYFIRSFQKGSIPQVEVNGLLSDLLVIDYDVIAPIINKWLDNSDLDRTLAASEAVIIGDDNDVFKRSQRAKKIILALISSEVLDLISSDQFRQIRLASLVVVWMQDYMFIVSPEGKKTYDEIMVYETIKHIFSFSNLQFCMDFLSSYYANMDVTVPMRQEEFVVLLNRQIPSDSDSSFENLLFYRRESLQSFFVMWKRVSPRSMSQVMETWLQNSSFPSESLIRQFVDAESTFLPDLELFVVLFSSEIESYMLHLEKRIGDASIDEFYKRVLANWRVSLDNYRSRTQK